ncbi:multicomponent Na+:H+ antiporter subunit F [Limimonas halophila]|uniref:Multicomponent Na+:H+ antiporter subunit F n=1 Tax=Limimonas halophila TaxID=1082479 RepID=A0A1G7NSW2_9PROT|nr:monovalent cation/H+ antiporter complex subunit F [Limimonas halophila]SDF77007.1 multicomponent Na+:H+ antiporter subunit F [Limimonas halophila]
MSPFFGSNGFLGIAVAISLVLVVAALLLTLVRLVRGPSLADRVVALDMLAILAIGFIALRVLATGETLYLEIAIALGLVAFLATVFFARLIERRGGELDHGYDSLGGRDGGREG